MKRARVCSKKALLKGQDVKGYTLKWCLLLSTRELDSGVGQGKVNNELEDTSLGALK